jgi:chromosome segregation ATPase
MFVSFCSGLAISILLADLPQGRGSIDQTRDTLSKWVETRQLIARTRSDWDSDREILEQSIKAFEKELSTLEEQLAKASGGSEQVVKESADLQREKESLRGSSDRLKELLPALEGKVQVLAKALPSPLVSRIESLLARVPTNSAETRISPLERGGSDGEARPVSRFRA